MGKGQARKRRLMNALKAKSEKKGKAFAAGERGKKRKQDGKEDKDVPSSFRKLLQLKAAAEGQSDKRSKQQLGQQRAARAAAGARPTARPVTQQHIPAGVQEEEEQLPQPAGQLENAAPSGPPPGQDGQDGQEQQQEAPQRHKLGQIEQAQRKSERAEQQQQRQQQRQGQQQQRQRQQQPEKDGGPFKMKALRADKKEFLKLKKLRKKHKLKGEDLLVEKERELLHRQTVSRPLFGEQAAAPIEANLKRRHWTQQGDEGAGAGAAKRCTQVFLQQMQTAQQRLAASSASAAAGAGAQQQRQQGKGSGSGGLAGGTKTGKVAASAGGGALARGAKTGRQHAVKGKVPKPAKGGSAGVSEEQRLQLIEAYRDAKRARLEAAGRGTGTTATPQSLAELVKRDAGRAAAAAELHQAQRARRT